MNHRMNGIKNSGTGAITVLAMLLVLSAGTAIMSAGARYKRTGFAGIPEPAQAAATGLSAMVPVMRVR